jgi:hypothetical protein
MWWLFGSSVALAGPCPPTFAFAGQPACVELTYRPGGTVLLQNTCEEPVLVDQRVLRSSDPGSVAPESSVEIEGLSWFTVGVGGELHLVTATVATPSCEPAPPPLRTASTAP